MVTRRPLLLVHGVYHRAWCFEEHWAPRLRARGHEVLAVDLPIGPDAFSLEEWSSSPATSPASTPARAPASSFT